MQTMRRDMTHKAFKEAAKRRGFTLEMSGVGITDTYTIGHVLRWSPSKNHYVIDRRESLKRAIESAKTHAEKEERKAQAALIPW